MAGDILIVGAGLSGLALADRLIAAGRSVQVIEARSRPGGRILTEIHNGAPLDLGPAWFWPGQPRIAALIARFGLRDFEQFATGALTYEDAGGVQRGRGMASMEGSLRVAGGFGALVSALLSDLPADTVRFEATLAALTEDAGTLTATLATGETLRARHVVLCLPPRLAARIAFDPPLPPETVSAMVATPTWMAGHAKAVAVYPTPFWRDAGLSGDAMSRVGPMVEIHDATPLSGGPGVLFGFLGVPAAGRRDAALLKEACGAQFARLFGPTRPQTLILKDWALDPATATPADGDPPRHHPHYGPLPGAEALMGGHLILSGSEAAPGMGGFLEGALEAAETAASRLA